MLMSNGPSQSPPLCRRCWSLPSVALMFAILSYGNMDGQTTSTGALTGVTLDSTRLRQGSVLSGRTYGPYLEVDKARVGSTTRLT